MKTKSKILVALLLVLTMLICMFTITSYAAEESTEETATTKTIYFTNNNGWADVYVHYWGGTTASQWPGVKMSFAFKNDYGQDVYSVSIPALQRNCFTSSFMNLGIS